MGGIEAGRFIPLVNPWGFLDGIFHPPTMRSHRTQTCFFFVFFRSQRSERKKPIRSEQPNDKPTLERDIFFGGDDLLRVGNNGLCLRLCREISGIDRPPGAGQQGRSLLISVRVIQGFRSARLVRLLFHQRT